MTARASLARLRNDARGVMLVEFAYCIPMVLFMALGLIELCNFALVKQEISQLALQIADNAGRMGSQTVLRNKPISEGEINDLLVGAELQSGRLDVATNGRIIVSSLEQNGHGNHQMIRWQRCNGALIYPSSYGVQGDGVHDDNMTGMGPADGRISSTQNIPVMFVEIGYRYRPMFFDWLMQERTITEIAALTVRDDRAAADPENAANDPQALCNTQPQNGNGNNGNGNGRT